MRLGQVSIAIGRKEEEVTVSSHTLDACKQHPPSSGFRTVEQRSIVMNGKSSLSIHTTMRPLRRSRDK